MSIFRNLFSRERWGHFLRQWSLSHFYLKLGRQTIGILRNWNFCTHRSFSDGVSLRCNNAIVQYCTVAKRGSDTMCRQPVLWLYVCSLSYNQFLMVFSDGTIWSRIPVFQNDSVLFMIARKWFSKHRWIQKLAKQIHSMVQPGTQAHLYCRLTTARILTPLLLLVQYCFSCSPPGPEYLEARQDNGTDGHFCFPGGVSRDKSIDCVNIDGCTTCLSISCQSFHTGS